MKKIIILALGTAALAAAAQIAGTTNLVAALDTATTAEIIRQTAAAAAPFAGPYAPLVTLGGYLIAAIFGAFIHHHGSSSSKPK